MTDIFRSHLFLMLLYAAFVSAAGGVLLKETAAEQLRTAGVMMAGLVGAAVVAGWILYVFPL